MSAPTLSTPLRELIALPEKVDASDYVLQLHEGVEQAERTLRDYVVTESIAESLAEALGLVARTVERNGAKGAFIHGSFGSGKSHFMAVLHLLLTGNLAARRLDGLAGVVDKHRELLGRRLLALDYHLLGAESLEQALFSGYLKTMRETHPEAPAPMLHVSDSLLRDAVALRERLGDEQFFATISAGGDDGWGDLGGAWTADDFEAAVRDGGPERERLVRDLTSTVYQGYTSAGSWLDISQGLERMTEHAKSLGYEGIVLFLDELVLWLGQHLSDSAFIQSETSKVAKLIETSLSVLPLPIVSFVARQRDLKDFLGDSIEGSQQEAIGQSFQWWEGRFERIELHAADLPRIVKQRLLQPVSEQAAGVLGEALSNVKRSGAWNHLLTDEVASDEQDFADVYPFSPALVDAMVALSSLMQRERTALKLMGELLAEGRDELTASDVIPVGDLFDQIMAGGSTPLTADMKKRFQIARDFYDGKLRPYLLNKHGLTDAAARELPRQHPFRTEDRLAKTLLIADLAPGAVSLRNLTAAKLAALNYGTINSYVPGAEAQQVVTWVKEWAQQFGEVTVGEGADPLIGIHLSGVDYDSVLERVNAEDNMSNRRQLLRRLVEQELQLVGGGLINERELSHIWRGQRRGASVIFGNVRDKDQVRPDDFVGDGWRIVIDFPFDPEDRPARDDLARLDELRESGLTARTIVWIPNFFTQERLADLGRLVKLEHVLLPAQFEQNASHLSAGDREQARQALENQRKTLRATILGAIRQAYAVSTAKPENVDDDLSPSEVFSTLQTGLRISPPVADSLLTGLQQALEQAWTHEHPDHPAFEPSGVELRRAELSRVVELVERAVTAGGRAEGLARPEQELLKRIAEPLQLGTLSENVFVATLVEFGRRDDFARWDSEAGGDLDVKALRAKLAPWGMARDVEDVLIHSWALIADREWLRGGVTIGAPALGQLTGDLVLREANLPDPDEWRRANEVAAALLGVAPERARISSAVRRFATTVTNEAKTAAVATDRLVAELTAHREQLGLDPATGRLATARRAQELFSRLASAGNDPLTVVTTLAGAGSDLTAEARAIASADAIQSALRSADWESYDTARRFENEPAVEQAVAALLATAAEDEHIAPLQPMLQRAMEEARAAVLRRAGGPTPPPAPGPVPDSDPTPVDDPDEVVLADVAGLAGGLEQLQQQLRAAMERAPGKKARIRWWLE